MQYVWQHRLWPGATMTTVGGERVDIIDPGLLNTGSGPDFFNAKIRIGNRMWAGNVEIHVRASDWTRHGHSADRAYDSVILHVVGADDARVTRPDGAEIPQVVMACNPALNRHYHELTDHTGDAPACAAYLPQFPAMHVCDWLTSLAMARLYRKSDHAAELSARFEGDWTAAVYVLLARGLGFGTNAEPFERLALSTPLRTLLRHADSPVAVEAMLFGQAGFLDTEAADAYQARLKEEYSFMKAKFGLRQPHSLGWKTGRIRPQNMPYRRIALLAAMVAGGFRAGYGALDVTDIASARRLLATAPSDYWRTRYTFGPAAEGRVPSVLSDASVAALVINVIVPVLSAYGNRYGRPELHERAVDMLYALPPENNSVIRAFTGCGIACSDAFTGQALIELRRSYCDQRKCLYCRFGHRILSNKATIVTS